MLAGLSYDSGSDADRKTRLQDANKGYILFEKDTFIFVEPDILRSFQFWS